MRIHQDAILNVADLNGNEQIGLQLGTNRHAYVHVAFGSVQVGDVTLKSGDAITFSGPEHLTITASEESQLLHFDLA